MRSRQTSIGASSFVAFASAFALVLWREDFFDLAQAVWLSSLLVAERIVIDRLRLRARALVEVGFCITLSVFLVPG